MIKIPTSYLWKAARAAEPKLWSRLESGQYDEDIVDQKISASLERAEQRIGKTHER
jgi:hypothetical protein